MVISLKDHVKHLCIWCTYDVTKAMCGEIDYDLWMYFGLSSQRSRRTQTLYSVKKFDGLGECLHKPTYRK